MTAGLELLGEREEADPDVSPQGTVVEINDDIPLLETKDEVCSWIVRTS